MDKEEKFIVHVDMDAFFASIEQRDHSAYKGKPVVVGADPKQGKGRGVVSTCSYEARKYGIHSAMPISAAYVKCPNAVFLLPDMEKYSAVSSQIHSIFNEFTPDVEPISIDEAFLDITGTYKFWTTPIETCKAIKSRIFEKTRLTCSAGIAPIKMAAKIASGLKKPDGLVEVTTENLLDFLWPLDIGKIWGLGEKSKAVLNSMSINTIGQLAKTKPELLEAKFGKTGLHFWQLANGMDEREVIPQKEAKSISNEITFEQDTADKRLIQSALLSLCEKVSVRLRSEGLKGKTITLKIRLEGFQTYTRAVTMDISTNFADVIYAEIKKLYLGFKTGNKKVRLVGVKVSNLCPCDVQETLFPDENDAKREKIHEVIDKVKRKFGYDAIMRAGVRIKNGSSQ